MFDAIYRWCILLIRGVRDDREARCYDFLSRSTEVKGVSLVPNTLSIQS